MPLDCTALKRAAAHRNLNRLSALALPAPTPRLRTGITDPCQIALNLLRTWSLDNADSIRAAVTSQAFGGKGPINWHTTFLPFMESMALYLRDYGLIHEAVDIFKDYRASGNDQTLFQTALDRYLSAQSLIDELAGVWGMDFVQITDLVTEAPDGHPLWDGPYCGVFITQAQHAATPCIGLAFKGTKPTNLLEINVDINYNLKAAGPYLGGQSVSQGVYTGLFGTFATDVPYNLILETLQTIATELPNISGAPPRVHITGHSLGGSYSTLATAQLLIDTLPAAGKRSSFVMGDEYTFGAPRVGSAGFADLVATLFDQHQGRSWRIVNNGDIVPQVPPSDLKPAELGFYHVDDGVQVFDNKEPIAMPSERGGPAPAGLRFGGVLKLIKDVLGAGCHCECLQNLSSTCRYTDQYSTNCILQLTHVRYAWQRSTQVFGGERLKALVQQSCQSWKEQLFLAS